MTPLAYRELIAPGATPERWVWFLHGFLGQGGNWQSFARRVAQERPSWGCLLIDLRLHGASQAVEPPHTMEAVAADLEAVARARGRGPDALVGHSFGGRAALRFAAERPPGLSRVWVLDAAPASQPQNSTTDSTTHSTRDSTTDSSTRRVLQALRELPQRFEKRADFSNALEERGVQSAIALWLAKNLRREEDGLRLGLQLDGLQALLDDHDRCDCWALVERPPPGLQLCFVLAGTQSVVRESDRRRLLGLAQRGVLGLEVLQGAGHWLHADEPAALLSLMLPALS